MPPAAAAVGVGGTTRWCPTAEQLMILEEMYRGGLRTPNASQIQQITAHLAVYGRIEGKNVFYWFQNHKARDRQKLRRRLCMTHHLLSCAHYYQYHHLAASSAPAPPPPLYSSPAGYYYPASFAAAPSLPTTPLFHYPGGGGGGGVLPAAAAALGRPEYSLGKLADNFGVAEGTSGTPASTVVDATPPPYDVEPAMELSSAAGEAMSAAPAPPFCRPLKTLDLFPGGLKEEHRDVA